MTNLFSIGLLWRPTHWLAPVIAGLALFLAPAAEAANRLSASQTQRNIYFILILRNY